MRARGRHLVMLDADGATRISDVSLLEAKLPASATQRTLPGAATTPAFTASLGMAVGSRAHLSNKLASGASRSFVMHKEHDMNAWEAVRQRLRPLNLGHQLVERLVKISEIEAAE